VKVRGFATPPGCGSLTVMSHKNGVKVRVAGIIIILNICRRLAVSFSAAIILCRGIGDQSRPVEKQSQLETHTAMTTSCPAAQWDY